MTRLQTALRLAFTFCITAVFVSNPAHATNFLLERQSGGSANTSHGLFGDNSPGDNNGDFGTTAASDDGVIQIFNTETGASGDMISQEEMNLYTAVGNTSGAPQANAGVQLIGGVVVNTPPTGIGTLVGDSTAFGSATYKIVDCPQTNALIVGNLDLFADPTTNSSWADMLVTQVSATVGSSSVNALNLAGAWQVQGFVSSTSGGMDVSGTYMGATFAESFPCSEYSTCGSNVLIDVFATTHLEYMDSIMTSEIVEATAHADFAVVTY